MPDINIDVRVAGTITRFATKSRYPDSVYDFTEKDTEFGLKYAKHILGMVKDVLKYEA